MFLLLAGLVLWLAYSNGANDNSKGVATLVGSRVGSYRSALLWGTVWTVLGGIVALALSAGLVRTFSTALVSTSVGANVAFPIAVVGGAVAWVLLASWRGVPVSTTHSLTGAIIGAALASGGAGQVRWPLVAIAVGAPLALSPLLAGSLAYALQAVGARPIARASRYCICVADAPLLLTPALEPAMTTTSVALPILEVGTEAACAATDHHEKLRLIDGAHWTTSAALSFARGLNDNPKIVALGAFAAAPLGIQTGWLFLASALAMGLGGYLFGRRVTRTLGERVTPIDAIDGLVSSAVASSLVLLACAFALPVSTTHVASGAIIGVGVRRDPRAVDWRTVRKMISAWIVTVPVSAALAAVVWLLLAR
jgi:PiT family inorganic phosphate transporter